MDKEKTKAELFIELAKPNEKGFSRWVNVSEFIGKYKELQLGNGGSWCRKESNLAKLYKIEFDKKKTKGNSIDRIKLDGLKEKEGGAQHINHDIKKKIKGRECVILGTSNPEVDHKNGRKNDPRIMNSKTQTISDFQPLSKAANDAKRQFCKECVKTNHRFDAKKLGYPISFSEGEEKHDRTKDGCIGCFWYDPLEFRKNLINKKLSK